MEKLLIKVYKTPKLTKTLGVSSIIISWLFVLSFLYAAIVTVYLGEYRATVTFSLSLLVGYLLVSAVRVWINAPRPYELYTFYEVPPKNRKGKSFPSRHAYSAFCIATLFYTVDRWLCLALVIFAVTLCVFRALLGIHFIRDLLAGAVIGFISGAAGLLLL